MARSFAHVTPRYIVDRLAWKWHEVRHPGEPWIAPAAIAALDDLLLPTDEGIEWGSGRSTLWFARRLRSLRSIESHKGWYAKVKKNLADASVTNVDYRLFELSHEDEQESQYTRAADDFPDQTLGFAMVDGAARATCANAVIRKLRPGGLLVIDNIQLFVDHPSRSPHNRQGKGPRDSHWAMFVSATQGWRKLWNCSGIVDTCIWFKPA